MNFFSYFLFLTKIKKGWKEIIKIESRIISVSLLSVRFDKNFQVNFNEEKKSGAIFSNSLQSIQKVNSFAIFSTSPVLSKFEIEKPIFNSFLFSKNVDEFSPTPIFVFYFL